MTAASRSALLLTSDSPSDVEQRFRALVQSPLRAGLLRFLNTRPDEGFDTAALMSALGRMAADIENCLRELVACGVVQKVPQTGVRFASGRRSTFSTDRSSPGEVPP